MRRQASWFVLLITALAGIARAQQRSAAPLEPNTVYISAQAAVEAAPDLATIHFDLSAQEKTAKTAYERTSRAVEQVREALRASGIDPSSAEFSSFQLRPIYDYHGAKRKIVTYQVNSNVKVKLKEFAKAGSVLDQITNLDSADNVTLDYSIQDTEDAKKKAVATAMEKARAEADAVAHGGGRTLGELVYASVDTQQIVPVRAFSGANQTISVAAEALDGFGNHRVAPASPPPTEGFTPNSVTLSATVYILFGLK